MNRIMKSALLAITLLFGPGYALAAVYYVSTSGSDSFGDGSSGSPWATISNGISNMSSGDTLIVRDGLYTGTSNFITNVPSGTPGNYTTVKAENPFQVRIQNSGSLNYNTNFVRLTGNYTKVEGFIFDHKDSIFPPYTVEIHGSYNKIMKTIVRRKGNVDEYGGWYAVGGTYNLLEDTAGVGGARYGYYTGGPSATTNNHIFRRCVARFDYSSSNQPKAAFAVYGNDSGYGVHHVLLQNIIAIDGRKGPNSGEATYGAVYFPKNVSDITIQGAIALNNEADHAGFFLKEMNSKAIKLENSIAWDIYGTSYIGAVRVNGSTQGPLTLDHLTIGNSANGYYNRDSASTKILTNSLFFNNGQLGANDSGWSTMSNNAFNPAIQAAGANSVTNNVSLTYLVMPDQSSGLAGAATDGSDIGATVMKQYGVSGTLWGEAGYDQLTSTNLWPWPYENMIKSVFSEPNNPPGGNTPSTNNTTRGFCQNTDQFGKPMTLTRYIWQYLGNQIPSSVYTSTPMTTPTGVAVIPVVQ